MDVVPLSEAGAAAREATAAIPVVERSTDRRWNRSSAGTHLGQAPVRLVTHDNPGRVAGQPLRRSGRNAHAVFELRLPGLIGVSQHGGVDMDYHLVALTRGAGIEHVMERRLREKGQRVRLLLGEGWRILHAVLTGDPAVDRLARGLQRS